MPYYSEILKIFCFMFLSFAYADNISNFNENAVLFNSKPLLLTKPQKKDDCTTYKIDGCQIAFYGEEKIVVIGKGDDFLAYCMSAVYAMETDIEKVKENAGLLFAFFLLSRGGEVQTWKTPGGLTAIITKEKKNFVFSVGR